MAVKCVLGIPRHDNRRDLVFMCYLYVLPEIREEFIRFAAERNWKYEMAPKPPPEWQHAEDEWNRKHLSTLALILR